MVLFNYTYTLIGIIWILVLLVSNGNVGENKYGADPKV